MMRRKHLVFDGVSKYAFLHEQVTLSCRMTFRMDFVCTPLDTCTVQITFIFIDFRVCDFAFKTQNAPCVSRFKRVLFSDRFQFAF